MSLIVNADDYGLNISVNSAIVKALEERLCNSISVMANMPGFEEGCQLLCENHISEGVGVHLVLTSGKPLTDGIRSESRLCDAEGIFLGRGSMVWMLPVGSEVTAIANECRAQIQRCRRQGVTITHLDSHHHIHEYFGVMRIVACIASEEGIPSIRLARNCGNVTGNLKAFYRRYVNWRLRRKGVARSDYFGSENDIHMLLEQHGSRLRGKTVEVMVHPGYSETMGLVDIFSKTPLSTIEELQARIMSTED